MEPTFVTVSEARKLTGKSERTIRRFLKSYVTKKSQYFQPDTQNGKSIWLIDSDFLNEHYEFKSKGDNVRGVAGDNDTVKSRDNKGLMDKWQQEAEKQRDMSREPAGHNVSDSSDNGLKNENDSDKEEVLSGQKNPNSTDASSDQAWDLVKKLQEQIEKKDEQLDRYFTQQNEMMTTMGRLMEQDNLLLARSQENPNLAKQSDANPGEESNVVDVDMTETELESELDSADSNNETVVETKMADKSESKKEKRGSWFGLFSG